MLRKYCLHHKILPYDPKKIVDIRKIVVRFVLLNNILYTRAFDGVLLICLSKERDTLTLHKNHYETCGVHQARPKLADQLKWLGYYWPIIVYDAIKFVKICKLCHK